MRRRFLVSTLTVLICPSLMAQSSQLPATAANPIQAEPAPVTVLSPSLQARELKIPAGTRLDIAVTNNVNSRDTRPGDLLSFRVLVPVKVEGVTVIDTHSLVTARVSKARRGGHWGKAGKLAWTMEDVVAVDLTRVPLTAHPEMPSRITGTSHGGEVATKTIVFGVLLAPFGSPLALMSGFKRGEDAVLPEGKRFIVYVERDTVIRVAGERSGQ